MMKYMVLLLVMLMMTACSSLQVGSNVNSLSRSSTWAMLPVINNTDTPQAGLRAEAIVQALVYNKGVKNIAVYPAEMNSDTLFEPAERKVISQAMVWAKTQGIRYAITGSVEEWHYKVGVDGEPAVGLTLKVIDLADGSVVWSAVGAKSGWSRSALSGVAQDLVKEMLSSLIISN